MLTHGARRQPELARDRNCEDLAGGDQAKQFTLAPRQQARGGGAAALTAQGVGNVRLKQHGRGPVFLAKWAAP